MMKICIDNKRAIEISETKKGTLINVVVTNSNGEVEHNYTITETEMVELLNKFENEDNID